MNDQSLLCTKASHSNSMLDILSENNSLSSKETTVSVLQECPGNILVINSVSTFCFKANLKQKLNETLPLRARKHLFSGKRIVETVSVGSLV